MTEDGIQHAGCLKSWNIRSQQFQLIDHKFLIAKSRIFRHTQNITCLVSWLLIHNHIISPYIIDHIFYYPYIISLYYIPNKIYPMYPYIISPTTPPWSFGISNFNCCQVPLEIPEVSARSLNRNVAQMRVQQAQQATVRRSTNSSKKANDTLGWLICLQVVP